MLQVDGLEDRAFDVVQALRVVGEETDFMNRDKKEVKWIALYFRDFDAAIRGHGPLFAGVYFKLFLAYLMNDCKGLPDDERKLKALCEFDGETNQWEDIARDLFERDIVLAKFFALADDNLWHQERAHETWKTSFAIVNGGQLGGLESAKKRKGKWEHRKPGSNPPSKPPSRPPINPASNY